ncbi:MAG: 16S rRNA (guanine(527)-N(7))-methyltransferase RsmG [Candidatus Paracaedibacteraceae bacterium]|nr:16S rRNA (guanine(527)-N(7))-methyltransferase RsmG [Candidatus Paracaedibacteraceae bacterium]
MFKTFVNTFPNLSTDIYQKIDLYYTLLKKWNQSHNLVQHRTLILTEFEMRHLIDSWQLISHFNKSQTILDIGSGAGIPGIFLAIAGFDVHLVELDKNKAAFLKNCKATLNLSCTIHSIDVYSISDPYQQVTSRAFSALTDLLKIQKNVSRETVGIYPKGENYLHEIHKAHEVWDFDVTISSSISSKEGRILRITNLKHKH